MSRGTGVTAMKKVGHLISFALLLLAFSLAQISCGGTSRSSNNSSNPSNSAQDLCVCVENEPSGTDYRTQAKHTDFPQTPATEINVATMLGWPAGADPAFDAPRQGRELQMFHMTNVFLQFVWINQGDCDMHLEISDSADKNAPRVIVETPHMDSFCSWRRLLGQQLTAHGITISTNGMELATPLTVDVLGMAFQDFSHTRGTPHVATVWELHPAVVTVK
jgi:hypothetical protein